MEQAIRAAGMVEDVEEDVEAARQLPSRKSLPVLDRVPVPRRSFSTTGRRTPAPSIRSRANSNAANYDAPQSPPLPVIGSLPQDFTRGDQDAAAELEDNDIAEELAWDPTHPCWPHLNTHVPISSPLYKSTRIIRIQRDYRVAGDLYPAFETLYPEVLEGCLSQTDFRALVNTTNERLRTIFDPLARRGWIDAIASAMSGWLLEDAGLTGVKRGYKELEAWCEQWNQEVGAPKGVQAISLRRTALLSLDLQVPDPDIGQGGGIDRVGMDADVVRSEIGSTIGGSQSMGTSASYSKAGGMSQPQAPSVPPIPREYLQGDS